MTCTADVNLAICPSISTYLYISRYAVTISRNSLSGTATTSCPLGLFVASERRGATVAGSSSTTPPVVGREPWYLARREDAPAR